MGSKESQAVRVDAAERGESAERGPVGKLLRWSGAEGAARQSRGLGRPSEGAQVPQHHRGGSPVLRSSGAPAWVWIIPRLSRLQ